MLLCPLLPWCFPRTCRRSRSNGKKNEPQSFLSMTLIYIHSSLQEQDPNPYIYVYITPRTLLYVFTSEDKVLVYIYITPRTKSRTTDKKKALFRTRPVRQTSYCFDVSIYIYTDTYVVTYVVYFFFHYYSILIYFYTHTYYITLQYTQYNYPCIYTYLPPGTKSWYIYRYTYAYLHSEDKVLVYR